MARRKKGDWKPLRVLVVDDDEDTADSMALVLQLNGHEVTVAYSGLSALREANKAQPHVVLLDIAMPTMDGYELAARLRKQNQHAILVALTGLGRESDKAFSKDAGMDSHLTKPVDPEHLQQLLATVRPASKSK